MYEKAESDLDDSLTKLKLRKSPLKMNNYLVSIAKGIKCVHDNGYVHRDIKNANVLKFYY